VTLRDQESLGRQVAARPGPRGFTEVGMKEKRKTVRQRVFKAGTISFNRAAGISCTVRNISDGGACLEVATPIGIPRDFQLHITSDQVTKACQMVWTSEHRIGVSFH
jgi:hypothetical protein